MNPLNQDKLIEAATAYREADNNMTHAAQALGVSRTTLQHRISEAARQGLLGFSPPVLPGFEVKQITNGPKGDFIKTAPAPRKKFEVKKGLAIKGISALLDDEGRIKQQWVLTRKDGELAVDWEKVFKKAFSRYEGRAKPIVLGSQPQQKLLTLIPCNDWHINMMCWAREVGENWDIKIAERTIGAAIDEVILRTAPAKIAVVLGGGDLMHNDDNTNRTSKSGNQLDTDGRFRKGIEAAQRLKVRTIDAALQHNEKVIVRILPGNHDEYSSIAITHFLAAWYRDEPRVEVDLDASLFWWQRWGSVLLGATHGHTVKLSQMPSIMAHRRAEDWGLTKFRYIHGFHIHHKEVLATEGAGVICESHQAPIPMDAWHWGSGFLSGRSMQTITYHKDYGETARIREAILEPPKA
jgi:hypothetical protein